MSSFGSVELPSGRKIKITSLVREAAAEIAQERSPAVSPAPPRATAKKPSRKRRRKNSESPGRWKRVCAFADCGAFIAGDPTLPEATSHGYCRECAAKEIAKIRARPKKPRQNPDEDLRELERLARRGDRAARTRLQAERRRRGLPGGHTPESSRGLYGKARDLSRHAPDRDSPGVWTNEDARIAVRETFNGFDIEDLDTGVVRGMGDGVDMFTDRRDRSLWPGTREFNEAMRREVEGNAGELREAYFG